MGSGFEANALVTMLCRPIGWGRMVSRTMEHLQDRSPSLVRADDVIHTERECGRRLAHWAVNPLGLKHHALAEGCSFTPMEAPAAAIGRTLRDLELRKRHDVNIVAIRHRAAEVGTEGPATRLVMPESATVIEKGDASILIGADAGVARLLGS
jgi:trk system potassium uptake protein TrkA